MNNENFLKLMFQAYYENMNKEIPVISSFKEREFAFIPWNKNIMMRHIGFEKPSNFKQYLVQKSPQHVYSSGALYQNPSNKTMDTKGFTGCDLIFDIDVDHFYTPCKKDHDIWKCKDCGKIGKGMADKCNKCNSKKVETLAWICEYCLNIAKKEILKLLYDFLFPDFGVKENEIKIAFSGHRGYHLKIENEKIRSLSGDQRRELVDYVKGQNISFEILGLKQVSQNIFGFNRENKGWSRKILTKIENLLSQPNDYISEKISSFDINRDAIKSFINSKDDFFQTILTNENNLWNISNFGITRWKKFLRGIVDEIGAEIDEPVTIDIHRLIRYPGSLHGKTGFKVQELSLSDLEDFTPLDESDESLDPLVFESSKNLQEIKIIENQVPQTKIKGKTFGPYLKDEKLKIPNHMAVFLISKGVAKII